MQQQLLVVEDDVVLQLSLTAMLRREGFRLITARTVAEARLQLLRERPSVVLLDLGLPDGSGLELLADLTSAPDGPLAIVSLPADTPAAASEAIRLGAFDYVARPINNDLLRAAVERAAEHYRLRSLAREVEHLRAQWDQMRAMARTMAHHISQHLTVIMGETQLLQEELDDPEVWAGLEQIVRAAEQSAQSLVELRTACSLGPADPPCRDERWERSNQVTS